jgi:hypothetical protein
MRAFVLVREVDVTGVSGTGVVAEGVEFRDGTVVMRWLPSGTSRPSMVQPTTVIHPDMENIVNLHGHDGLTKVRWVGSDVLLPFSEWLDTNDLMVSPEGDSRTHEDLVREFLEDLGARRSPGEGESV